MKLVLAEGSEVTRVGVDNRGSVYRISHFEN